MWWSKALGTASSWQQGWNRPQIHHGSRPKGTWACRNTASLEKPVICANPRHCQRGIWGRGVWGHFRWTLDGIGTWFLFEGVISFAEQIKSCLNDWWVSIGTARIESIQTLMQDCENHRVLFTSIQESQETIKEILQWMDKKKLSAVFMWDTWGDKVGNAFSLKLNANLILFTAFWIPTKQHHFAHVGCRTLCATHPFWNHTRRHHREFGETPYGCDYIVYASGKSYLPIALSNGAFLGTSCIPIRPKWCLSGTWQAGSYDLVFCFDVGNTTSTWSPCWFQCFPHTLHSSLYAITEGEDIWTLGEDRDCCKGVFGWQCRKESKESWIESKFGTQQWVRGGLYHWIGHGRFLNLPVYLLACSQLEYGILMLQYDYVSMQYSLLKVCIEGW